VRYTPDGTSLDKINLVIPALGTVTAQARSPQQRARLQNGANLNGEPSPVSTQMAARQQRKRRHSRDNYRHHSNPSFLPDMKGMAGRSTQRPDEWRQKQSFGRIKRPFRKEENPTSNNSRVVTGALRVWRRGLPALIKRILRGGRHPPVTASSKCNSQASKSHLPARIFPVRPYVEQQCFSPTRCVQVAETTTDGRGRPVYPPRKRTGIVAS